MRDVAAPGRATRSTGRACRPRFAQAAIGLCQVAGACLLGCQSAADLRPADAPPLSSHEQATSGPAPSGARALPPDEAAGYRPPDYVDRAAFSEELRAIGPGGALRATITRPSRSTERPKDSGAGWPIVVLVPGSGAHDADESVGPNKPFRDLAWGLGSRGIVVLRYAKARRSEVDEPASRTPDDRSAEPTLAPEAAIDEQAPTVKEEALDDAFTALRAAHEIAGIDPSRIFVLGHSLGATVIPRIAKSAAEVRGFVLLGGATRPLEDVLLGQIRYLALLDGSLSDREKLVLRKLEAEVRRVKELAPADSGPEHAAESGELPLGRSRAFWLDLRAHPTEDLLRDENRPFLVLHGGRDYQVTLDDFAGWKRALGHNAQTTFKLYPALNHLFMAGAGPSTPSEYRIAGHVDCSVIVDVVAWIREH